MHVPRLDVGSAAEINFIGKKLMQLPPKERKIIYDGLHSTYGGDLFGKAVVALLELIVDAPTEELTKYISNALEAPFDLYVFMGSGAKAHLFAAFFFNHLYEESNGLAVRSINLKTLAVL